jgi:hypothetical protein
MCHSFHFTNSPSYCFLIAILAQNIQPWPRRPARSSTIIEKKAPESPQNQKRNAKITAYSIATTNGVSISLQDEKFSRVLLELPPDLTTTRTYNISAR